MKTNFAASVVLVTVTFLTLLVSGYCFEITEIPAQTDAFDCSETAIVVHL